LILLLFSQSLKSAN